MADFQADLYADKEEILIGAPALTETVFYVDRESLDAGRLNFKVLASSKYISSKSQ